MVYRLHNSWLGCEEGLMNAAKHSALALVTFYILFTLIFALWLLYIFVMTWTQLTKFAFRCEGFPGLRDRFRRNLGKIWWRFWFKFGRMCLVFEKHDALLKFSITVLLSITNHRPILRRALRVNLAELTFWLLFLRTAGTRTKLLKRCWSQRCWWKWMKIYW